MLEIYREELDPDCGCLEREVDAGVAFLNIHLKPNGLAEIFYDTTEAEGEFDLYGCASLDEAQERAVRHVDAILPQEH